MRPPLLGAFTFVFLTMSIGGLTAFVGSEGAPPPPPPPSVGRPPASELSVVPHPSARRPPYLVPVVDPVFGSTITRVSDQVAFDSAGTWLRHGGEKLQPWNADGSLLLLGYTNPGFVVDGRSYAYRGRLLRNASTGVWSNVDPDVFYATREDQLLRLHVSSGRWEVVRAFPGWDSVSIGDGEGSPSNDDRTLALTLRTGPRGAVVLVDPVDGVELASMELPAGAVERLDWAAVSQNGQYVVLHWLPNGPARGSGVDLYERRLRFLRHLLDDSERADLGRDADGQEVLVTFDPARGKREGDQLVLVSVRLADGRSRVVLRTDWVGTHVSCRNTERPGWCYVSDSAVDAPRARTGGYDEVYGVRLDGTGRVERFAQAHQSPGIAYDWTTLAVPSRDGGRVLFTSDWGRGRTSPAYSYVASFGDAPPTPEEAP